MKYLYLLLIIAIVSCSKDEVKPDMTAYLVGSYKLDFFTNMGEEKNYRWKIDKETDSTIQIRMTKIYTPFKGNPATQSDTTISGIKVRKTHEIDFSYQHPYDYPVSFKGILYQETLYVKSDYLGMDTGFIGYELKFKRE